MSFEVEACRECLVLDHCQLGTSSAPSCRVLHEHTIRHSCIETISLLLSLSGLPAAECLYAEGTHCFCRRCH